MSLESRRRGRGGEGRGGKRRGEKRDGQKIKTKKRCNISNTVKLLVKLMGFVFKSLVCGCYYPSEIRKKGRKEGQREGRRKGRREGEVYRRKG